MLPSKLAQIKKELAKELYLDDDDKKSLKILELLDRDVNFQGFLQSDYLIKSFAVAPKICKECGRPI